MFRHHYWLFSQKQVIFGMQLVTLLGQLLQSLAFWSSKNAAETGDLCGWGVWIYRLKIADASNVSVFMWDFYGEETESANNCSSVCSWEINHLGAWPTSSQSLLRRWNMYRNHLVTSEPGMLTSCFPLKMITQFQILIQNAFRYLMRCQVLYALHALYKKCNLKGVLKWINPQQKENRLKNTVWILT